MIPETKNPQEAKSVCSGKLARHNVGFLVERLTYSLGKVTFCHIPSCHADWLNNMAEMFCIYSYSDFILSAAIPALLGLCFDNKMV